MASKTRTMLEGLAREGSFRQFLDKQSSFSEKLDIKAFSSYKYSYLQMLKLSLYFVLLTCLLLQQMYLVEFCSIVI